MCIGSITGYTQRPTTLGICVRCDHHGNRQSGLQPASFFNERGVADCPNWAEAPIRLKPAHPSLQSAARPGAAAAIAPAPQRATAAL